MYVTQAPGFDPMSHARVSALGLSDSAYTLPPYVQYNIFYMSHPLCLSAAGRPVELTLY